MRDEFFTDVWIGQYVYGQTYRDMEGETYMFVVDLVVKDGVLSGSVCEEVTDKLMGGTPAVVSGFIEGHMISMIKQYPYYYYTDKAGKLTVDRDRRHPAIHYTGYYDEGAKVFSGEWEIESVVERDFWGGERLHIASGTWEMKKKAGS